MIFLTGRNGGADCGGGSRVLALDHVELETRTWLRGVSAGEHDELHASGETLGVFPAGE